MHKYATIKNALSIFSIQTGLGDDAARMALIQSLARPEWRHALRQELEQILIEEAPPWIELVVNADYELDEPEDEQAARAIVLRHLWDDAFPERPRPFE